MYVKHSYFTNYLPFLVSYANNKHLLISSFFQELTILLYDTMFRNDKAPTDYNMKARQMLIDNLSDS